ncbi:MAG: S-layer homology domain-containing protein [Candidatus Gracilibacteria bacterium]
MIKSPSRFFVVLPFLLILFLASCSASMQTSFLDVEFVNPNYDAIVYVQTQGIVSGYEDGTFGPSKKINRAEFTKILIGAQFTAQQIETCVPKLSFSDVFGDEWFAPYVCVAGNEGIISGYSDGTFRPSDNVNFAEAAKILVGAFDYEVGTDAIWYKPFVQALENRGAIPTSLCSFDQSVSRGDMAEMIYRLKENISDKTSMAFFSEDANLIDGTTFSKQYSVKARTWGNGISTTSDGGYIVTGTTIPKCEMCDTDAYISKLTSTGAAEWTRLVQTVAGGSGGDEGHVAIQLSDGSYLMAGETPGFETDEEIAGTCYTRIKTFFSKFDAQGNHQWSRNFPFGSDDLTDSIYPAQDGGFFYLDNLSEWETQDAGGDIYHEYPFSSLKLIKFSGEGSVEWIKRISADDDDNSSFALTSDGGFIFTGNFHYLKEDGSGDESSLEAYDSLEGIMKLDRNGDLEWAKTVETLPAEIPTAIMNEDGIGYTLDYLEWRMPAGWMDYVKETPDGGFMAIGPFSMIAMSGLDLPIDMEATLAAPLLAVKMDGDGNYEWAKIITVKTETYKNDLFVEKTADNGFILVWNFSTVDADSDEKTAQYTAMINEINTAFENGEMTLDEATAAYGEIPKDLYNTSRYNFLVIKTDENFNGQWVKQVGGETAISATDTVMTVDQGVAIIGSVGDFVNDNGEYMYVVKLDANGNVGASSDFVFDYEGGFSSEDVTAYVLMNDLEATSLDYDLEARDQSPFTPSYSNTVTTIDPVAETSAPLCTIDYSESAGDVETKTWAQIYYEGVENVETTNDTSLEIYNEMMPILNELYNNEVKLWDNFYGMMLDFAFSRLTTEEDVAAVQDYYEGLGYEKIEAIGGNDLTMSRVGRMLNFDFSITDKMKGTLEVTW